MFVFLEKTYFMRKYIIKSTGLKWLVFLLMVVSCAVEQEPIYRFNGLVNIDGWSRTYLLNLPPGYYENDKFPLVVALHGTGGSALQAERDYGLTLKAESSNYVIVYPEGVPRPGVFGIRTWNAGKCCDYAKDKQIDDVEFINTVIDRMISDFKVDPNRIYITGMSNGAMMAYRFACEKSERINAIAPVSGTLMANSCKGTSQVPILHIHSKLDEVIPYKGGIGLGGYDFVPVDSTLSTWLGKNDCPSEPVINHEHESYTYKKWECKNDVSLELYLTKDGGHSWPGGLIARPGADPPSDAIDATDLIWKFFERY